MASETDPSPSDNKPQSDEATAPAPSEAREEAQPTAETTAADPSTVAEPAPAETAPAEAAPAETAPAEAAPAEAAPAEAAPAEAAPAEAAPAEALTREAATSDAEDEGEEQTEGAEAAEGEPAKKKKRRRRKKKKGAAEAGAEGGAPAPGGEKHHHHRGPRPATERAPFHVGEEVFGKVTAVLDTAIMIDLSGKALAIFDRGEMEPDDLVPGVSDRFVARVHNDGSRGGLVVLTRKPLREEEAKPKVEQAEKDGTHVRGLVTGVIKGGVEVDIDGLRAFAPASGMDLHPQNANFASLLGQQMEFKVVQYKNAGRDVVVTRRPMLEAEAHERRKHAITLLTEGQVLSAVVRTVVEWGAFVALPEAENLEGLVHVTEATHDPRARLTDLFKPGDQIEVKIIKIDEKGKIWLSRKALIEDPWAAAREKYAQGTRHKAKVLRLLDFGAFVELEPGVEGLIHITDLSMNRIEHPKEVLEEGQEIDVVVHRFDTRDKKIGLHPAPPPEQADEAPQKVARNNVVKVEVVKHESSGLIVRILGATGRAARGFLPAGQTGTPRGTDLRKSFKVGSQLEVKVIDVDPRRGEPKLSIKAMKEDEERRAHREYRQALQREGGFGTLGDLLAKKLKGISGDSE